jgi:hypothetical protein
VPSPQRRPRPDSPAPVYWRTPGWRTQVSVHGPDRDAHMTRSLDGLAGGPPGRRRVLRPRNQGEVEVRERERRGWTRRKARTLNPLGDCSSSYSCSPLVLGIPGHAVRGRERVGGRHTLTLTLVPGVGWLTGLEPATTRSTIWSSNHLSYSHHAGGKPYGLEGCRQVWGRKNWIPAAGKRTRLPACRRRD